MPAKARGALVLQFLRPIGNDHDVGGSRQFEWSIDQEPLAVARDIIKIPDVADLMSLEQLYRRIETKLGAVYMNGDNHHAAVRGQEEELFAVAAPPGQPAA